MNPTVIKNSSFAIASRLNLACQLFLRYYVRKIKIRLNFWGGGEER